MSRLRQTKKFLNDNGIKRNAFLVYLGYYPFRLKYKIGLLTYLENNLFDKKQDHEQFFNHLHTYIHSWKHLKKIQKQRFSKIWFFFHKIHYFFCKFLYPGLDAMDYFRYKFYRLPHSKRKTFITERKSGKLNDHFNPHNELTTDAYTSLDDKSKFNVLFSEFIHRDWIDSFSSIDEQVQFCLKHQPVFFKPISSGAGNGVEKLSFQNKNDAKDFFERHKNFMYIIEEAIQQNKTISLLNPSSINTIRINTLLHNGEVHIICAAMRFGKENSDVDNYSLGNFVASLDIESGKINSHAVNQNLEQIKRVSLTGTDIIGLQIPCWEEIKSLVKKAHVKIPQLKYIGWDVAINDKNEPLLVEGNTYAGVELQQHPSLDGKKYLYKKYW